MKIMWHGVPSGFKTGYGVQTKLFTKALKAAGHEVVISPTVTLVNGIGENEDGIKVLGNGPRNCNGNDFIRKHFQTEKPDVVFSMLDTFVLDLKKFKQIPWIPWQVIDGAPLLSILKKPCQSARMNLAMSEFGLSVLEREAGNIPHDFIPLAYDPQDFFHVDKTAARTILGAYWQMEIGNRPLFVVNAANMSQPSRKNFGATFDAFRIILRDLPTAILYLHTEGMGLMNGENLYERAKLYPEFTMDNVIFADQYQYNMHNIPSDFLRLVYSAADLMLSTSMAEGFGVPIIEAQACGCPVIAPDCTSISELVQEEWLISEGMTYSPYVGVNWFVVDPKEVARMVLAAMDDSLLNDFAFWQSRVIKYTIKQVYKAHMVPVLKRITSGEIDLADKIKMMEGEI